MTVEFNYRKKHVVINGEVITDIPYENYGIEEIEVTKNVSIAVAYGHETIYIYDMKGNIISKIHTR